MARMKREEWYNIARDVDWTRSYVDEEAVLPEGLSGSGKGPRDAWKSWDEPYKCAYSDYVATQREKEGSVYAVKAALQRSNIFESLDEGWKSTAKVHFGAVSLIEYLAVLAEQRMGRFGLSPAWRNMAVFGALDEIRHTQMDLYLAHEFIAKDPQFDWALKNYHTNCWCAIVGRATFDGMMMNPNVVDIAIQLPFTFETGFTNLQFVALAADALDSGDISFANMISSTQTDEARHAQQGGPTLEILMQHDPKRAQWIIDKTVWIWRPTVWWKPQGGVSKAERAWLQEKYPHWEEQWGPIWDSLIENINAGNMAGTLPETLPWLCNLCHLPIGTAASPHNPKYPVRSYPLTHNGYTYHFCSRPCRQIWWEDKDMLHQKTVIERLLAGEIQPPDVGGILTWMGLTPEIMGDDAYKYKWAEEYREPTTAAGAEGGSHG